MPNRILREGILSSERVASLNWPAEVFYRRLMSVVDDYGRFFAKPELLISAAYPLQHLKVGNSDIGKWTRELAKAGLVRTYAVGGKEYLELLNFRQQVRVKLSKFPAPPEPENEQQVRSRRTAGAQHMRTYTEADSESYSEKAAAASESNAPARDPPLAEKPAAAAAALSNGFFYPEKLTSAERREAEKELNGNAHAQFMLDELAGVMAEGKAKKPIALLVSFVKLDQKGEMRYSHASQIQAARELAQVEAELAVVGKTHVLAHN